MFSKVKKKYLTPYVKVEDFRIQVKCPPANYVCACHGTSVKRGALGYVSYQKGVILRHPGHIVAQVDSTAITDICLLI